MKKLTLLLTLIALVALAAPAFAANGDAHTTAVARQAVNECIQNARQAGYDVLSGVNVTGICFVSGEMKQVTFWGNPKCAGNMYCTQVSVMVATVDLGCDDEVLATSCYFMEK